MNSMQELMIYQISNISNKNRWKKMSYQNKETR